MDCKDTQLDTRCDNPGTKGDICHTCTRNISPDFRYDNKAAEIALKISKLDKTPEAIIYFSRRSKYLDDYSYWFFLSTLWVSYTGYSNLDLWIKLFSSDRPKKITSIMKPSELIELEKLPEVITAYRVHRPNENNWIAYTLNFKIAQRFAKERNQRVITEYSINKKDILALFLRRGEYEIIVLDKNKVNFINETYLERDVI